MYEIHKAIGDILRNLSISDAEVMLDSACGGTGQIRLYGVDSGCGSRCIAYVDAAIVLEKEIKVVIEIDFSNVRPVALCGKVLGTAISNHFKRKKHRIPLSDSMLFIQVVQHATDKPQSRKLEQCRYLEAEIGSCLVAAKNRITQYSFHYGMPEDFCGDARHGQAIREEITTFLKLQAF